GGKASTSLAPHPRVRHPLNIESPACGGVVPPSASDCGARINWLLDGVPVPPSQMLTLRRGQRLEADSREPLPLGIMLVDARNEFVFCRPALGITREASHNP